MNRWVRAWATALMLCVAGGAAAQGAVIPPADASREAAINRLLGAMEYEKSLQQMLTQMKAVLPQQMAASSRSIIQQSGLSEAEKLAAFAKLDREMPALTARLYDQVLGKGFIEDATRTAIEIYGRHFTTDEISQLADFYSTPLGRKVTSKLPVIMQESMQASMGAIQKRLPALMAELEKDLKAQAR